MSPHELAPLIDAHAGPLVLYARQWSDSPEDVVQEAFVGLLRLRREPANAAAWLYRAVRHRAIDAGRSDRRRRSREQRATPAQRWFVEPESDGLIAEEAVNALTELPDDQREVIVARLWGGLTFEEIAELCGSSVSTAHRRYEGGLASLRQLMGVSCPDH